MNKRIILIATLALAAVACGDDDDNDSDGGVQIRTDASIPNPTLDASIDSSTPNNQLDSSTPGDGSTPTVKGAPGCFAGTPTTSVQFLNACAEGYREFNNETRLPGYKKGQPLPAL